MQEDNEIKQLLLHGFPLQVEYMGIGSKSQKLFFSFFNHQDFIIPNEVVEIK